MASKINTRTYKGTRDFLPEQMVKRQFVINKIINSFERYGFEPLETPALELMETLGGKYGDEGDKLLYNFEDRGGRQVGLRYDLTVPLSRVMAMYPQIIKPFKRYQIQPVWRADKPQKGRFREFYQCDVDITGTSSLLADAEIISVLDDAFVSLGFNNILLKINDRKILFGITQSLGLSEEKEFEVIRSIDKFDKIGRKGVEEELLKMDYTKEVISKLLNFLDFKGTNEQKLNHAEKFLSSSPAGLEGVSSLRNLFKFLSSSGIPEKKYIFDLYLARGLDYYTGPIFEAVVKDAQIGSVAGGGRYDKLIGLFKGEDIPAVGVAIGLERIITVMEELNLFPAYLKTTIEVLVTIFSDQVSDYCTNLAKKLRSAGIKVDLFLGNSKLRGQLGYAADKGIPLVIIAGPDEIEQNKVTLKNMVKGTQEQISEIILISTLKDILAEIKKGI